MCSLSWASPRGGKRSTSATLDAAWECVERSRRVCDPSPSAWLHQDMPFRRLRSMASREMATRLLVTWVLLTALSSRPAVVECVGVNWGTLATHQLPPKKVVQMLRDNGITEVKLFDTEQSTMSALAGTGFEVMVAIPNDMLGMVNDYGAAKEWVQKNVRRYNFEGGVDIRYVAVGNEPFLKSYNDSFTNITFPALRNIQNALNEAGQGSNIKAVIPLNADVYDSPADNPVPSAGNFRADIGDLMTQIVQFLNQNNAPFVVNIYPFLCLYGHDDFPLDYAFFDGVSKPIMDNGLEYTNVFDANFDTLVSALKKAGAGDMPIVIGEVGWPTDGDKNANVPLAQRFYNGLMPRLATNKGTPLRPNTHVKVYLFGLLDEDAKSIAPGSFERHWGIFTYDGQPKFPVDLSGQGQSKWPVGVKDVKYLPEKWCILNPSAPDLSTMDDNVNFACSYADCTALANGSSCSNLSAQDCASYAFNMYFQTQNQEEESCQFQGLGLVTTQNYSKGSCDFPIQIASSSSSALVPLLAAHLFFLGLGLLLFT